MVGGIMYEKWFYFYGCPSKSAFDGHNLNLKMHWTAQIKLRILWPITMISIGKSSNTMQTANTGWSLTVINRHKFQLMA